MKLTPEEIKEKFYEMNKNSNMYNREEIYDSCVPYIMYLEYELEYIQNYSNSINEDRIKHIVIKFLQRKDIEKLTTCLEDACEQARYQGYIFQRGEDLLEELKEDNS